MHGVLFNAKALSQHQTVDFSFYFPETDFLEGKDHHIKLAETDRAK